MSNNYVGLRALAKADPVAAKSDPVAAKRCAERLIAIRASLESVRANKNDGTLLLATWNIRDFDSNKFGFGPRLAESFYYIAEMISAFDLVALQEINRDLSALEKIMRILGREWDYIATDTSGNDERMVFVYNTEKVWFRKVAGEIVLPEGQLVVAHKKVKPPTKLDEGAEAAKLADATKAEFTEVKQQFARTPFLVAFQSGWFRFSLCTVHIYYGEASGMALKQRVDEIRKLVGFFAERQDKASKQEKDRAGNVENYILLGDFNVVSPKHETMEALKDKGFTVPPEIDGDAVRKKGDHYYDQMAVRVKDKRFKVLKGGMIDMYADVFRETPDDLAIYKSAMPAEDPEKKAKFKAKTPEALYKKWRTWQMSDHHPLWIAIRTDFADDYLSEIAKA